MTLYQQSDIDYLSDNWSKINENVEIKRIELGLQQSYEEQKQIFNIVIDFVKQHKRKIYGGHALNYLISDKNPDDAIYKDDDKKIGDVDFYSPEPVEDLMKLCNILFEKGFKNVMGKEAQHQETYSVFVNFNIACDISYVPRLIYNKMPFKEIKGVFCTHPNFISIDYLRMLTDPLTSYWRIGDDLKAFRRFQLLMKHYPFPNINSPIEIDGSTYALDIALTNIHKFLENRKTTITVGFYAYNHFLKASKIKNNLKLIQVPYYEIISADYRNDALELIKLLKGLSDLDPEKVKHIEFYPFFQFTGYSVELYYDDDLIARIYNNNKRCNPYKDVTAHNFPNIDSTTSFIRIGTFNLVLLYALITIMRSRTENDSNNKDLYYTIVSHMLTMRNTFFKTEKKTFLDESIFQDFTIDCVGEAITPEKQRKLLIESRKKKHTRLTFIYEPIDGIKEPESGNFANSSGRDIKNPKNLKLTEEFKEEDIEGDVEDEIVENQTQ